MTDERFFVTGALGCIGAWVVRNLVRAGVPTTIFDLGGDDQRLRLILSADELAQVRVIGGDITDLAAVEAGLAESGATRIIHLAALQVPFCKADPALGARVNVVGTVNLFEAAKRAGIGRLVYASSVAVYGKSEEYGEGALDDDAPQRPRTHYGVYKQANEGTAKIYWLDDGISSVGLRPYTIYGPGRDQGLTSSPTKAMVAAALGRPFHIPFSGTQCLQHADDVAQIFIQAARAGGDGAEVYNLRGSVVDMGQIVAAIEAAAPASRGQISFDGAPLPFPTELDDSALRAALGPLPETPLAPGVAASIAIFRAAIADGRLNPARYLG
jgi:nucleoside-diphosphate-sugar epimerase